MLKIKLISTMKTIIFFIAFALAVVVNAQVGVGNETPRGLLDVNDAINGNASAGLILPHADDPTQLINPSTGETSEIPGAIAFDKTK